MYDVVFVEYTTVVDGAILSNSLQNLVIESFAPVCVFCVFCRNPQASSLKIFASMSALTRVRVNGIL